MIAGNGQSTLVNKLIIKEFPFSDDNKDTFTYTNEKDMWMLLNLLNII